MKHEIQKRILTDPNRLGRWISLKESKLGFHEFATVLGEIRKRNWKAIV